MLLRILLLLLARVAYIKANFAATRGSTGDLVKRTNVSTTSCCSVLAPIFGPLLSFPNSSVFNNEQTGPETGYFSSAEQSVIPACRIFPTNTGNVSHIVKFLSDHDCRFAIRGGGHMIWAGSANIQDGVTVDLSQMSDFNVLTNQSVVSVGPGCRWGDVYKKLDPLGLAVVGGRVETVGVAGLTIGGGNSWFAARHGFVCDNVVGFEVVLSSGEIVYANVSNHANLYKALKGGGNNIGVVTRFDYKLFAQSSIWGGFVIFSPNTTSAQLEALQDFNTAQGDDQDDYAAIESIHAYNSSGPTTLGAIIAYTKPQSNPPILSGFLDGRPQLSNDLKITNLSSLSAETVTPKGNWVWAHLTTPNNATTLAKVNSIMQEVFTDLPVKGKNYTFTNVFQPINRAITRKAATQGGNVLGLSTKDDIFWDNFSLQFWERDDEAIFNEATRKYIDRVNEYVATTTSRGHSPKFVYMNYAHPTQLVIQSYGQDNVNFLRTVSKKYDPRQTFRKLVPGGFKLP